MQARDLMSSPAITISGGATVGEAARLMLERQISCLPVVDDEKKLVGMLTHDDLGLHPRFMTLVADLYSLLGVMTTPKNLEEVSHKVSSRLVKEVVRHTPVITIQEDASDVAVAETMLRHQIHHLPVMRGSELVGVITRHDLMKLIVPGQQPGT